MRTTFGSYTLIKQNEFCGIGQHYNEDVIQPYVVWNFYTKNKKLDVDDAVFYENLAEAEKEYLDRSERKGAKKL